MPISQPPLAKRLIVVLVPVYNGAEFLEAQLCSIFEQTYPSIFVLCRDDGSTDTSPAILDKLAAKWPSKMKVLLDDQGNLGASGNFAFLMEQALNHPFATDAGAPARAHYVALSDQDDLWHPDKLAVCAARLEELELEHPDLPAVVHSDLRVVAHDASVIAPSMARYQGLQTQHQGFAAQLLSNTLTGCTSLMNLRLIEESLPVPQQAIMHDWWLSLVASAWGVRSYIDQPLIDYRQHAGNAIGAKERATIPLRKWRFQRMFDNRHADIFRLNAIQADAFLVKFGSRLSLRNRCVLWAAKCLAIPLPPMQRVLYRLLRRA